MSERSDKNSGDFQSLRLRVLGLGERSFRKSYYPELQRRMRDLERFRALLDASTDGILLIELPTLRCVDANRAAVAMLEQVGERFDSVVVKELLPSELAWLQAPPGQEAPARRERVKLKGRTGERWIELTAGRHHFEDRDYGVFVLRDIQERLEAERRRKESEERFRELADLLPAIVYETDPEGRLTFINQQAYALTGYGESDADRIGFIDKFLVMEDRKRAVDNTRRVLAGETLGATRYEFVCSDGSTIPVLSRSAPIFREGAVVGLRGLLLDMSERVELEQRALTSHKLASMGRLAGGVAHDFNNVLGGIMGLCDLILLDLPEGSGIRSDVINIKRAATRAAQLTAQLLLFSRQRPTGLSAVDLNDLMKQFGRMISRVTGEDIRVETELGTDLWHVSAEPSQIDQIVMNLVLNARDAMPDGGELRISTRNVVLDCDGAASYVGDLRAGEYVQLRVEDTGRGIDPSVQNRVFEPFFTTKEAGKGTGLGLATVYGVVKRNGGGVRLFSSLGKGTEFQIVLPRAEPLDSVDGSAERVSQPGSGTVLVTDDDDTIREMVRRALSRYGYRVLSAAHPKNALEIARNEPRPVDLLLTDMVMPEMSGFTLASEFRRQFPKTRVLFMSGYSEGEHAARGIDPETIDFIQKPFTVQELLALVESILGREA